MRSGWTPSIVPNGHNETVYIVEDDFGEAVAASAKRKLAAKTSKARSRI